MDGERFLCRIAALGLLCQTGAALGAPLAYRIDPAQSYFTVITHAAGLGHDHLIVAGEYRAKLMVDESYLAASQFDIVVPVASLRVNPPEISAALLPRLETYGLANEPFVSLSEEERKTMSERIASAEQMDAKRHPEVTARMARVIKQFSEQFGSEYQAEVAMTIRGRTVMRKVPVSLTTADGQILATAIGEFRFSEFGIEPFSAGLGVIRNQDKFHMYVELRATQEGK